MVINSVNKDGAHYNVLCKLRTLGDVQAISLTCLLFALAIVSSHQSFTSSTTMPCCGYRVTESGCLPWAVFRARDLLL
jgi:hypothetical protein